MAEFGDILASIMCLVFAFLTACSASPSHTKFCSKNSEIDTRTTPEGNIIFPSPTLNFSFTVCQVVIRTSWEGMTELTLKNLRPQRAGEECGNYVDISSLTQPTYGISNSRFCLSVGNKSPPKITLRSTIWIEYGVTYRNEISGNSTKDAISVHYKRLDTTKPCQHLLTGQSGTFQTFGYPSYPLEGECEWTINTGAGHGILLEFTISNFGHLNCLNNFIEVRVEKSNGPELVKICSRFDKKKIKSPSTKVWVHVKSSEFFGIGFRATYRPEICEHITAENRLNFQSPITTSCQTWNLTASPGHIAALSFSHLNFESSDSKSCSGNVLEVWDGQKRSSYCNLNRPPSIITSSKGRTLVVTYTSKYFPERIVNRLIPTFEASFTSIVASNYKTSCFVEDRELKFRCTNQQVIPCSWECDGAMQCSDNSDESQCSDNMEARWHKLQVFVIVMGSICASTVAFCVGLVCCRKYIINDGSSSRRSRHLSINDQSPLTPNADLPSPPPCYFNNQEEEPPTSVVRGTYFFGDEFSQSGIHNASLFGIPPPRYRSTESLHQSSNEARSIWQRTLSSIPLVPTDNPRGTDITSLQEEAPPDYESASADKDEEILTAAQNDIVCVENTESGNFSCSSNDCSTNDSREHCEIAAEILAQGTETSDCGNIDIEIGVTNPVATLNV